MGRRAYGYDPDLGNIRESEQRNALARLGVGSEHIIRLRLPDSDVGSHETELVDKLLSFVTKGTHLVAPWRGDFHPDHEACGRAAEQVANRTGARLTSYFFWTWHRGTTTTLDGLSLRSFPLNPHHLWSKSEALRCHRSQLTHESGEPILPENLLAPARRPFEVFCILMTTNTTSQEFFEAKYRENNDPWAFASNAYEQKRYSEILRALDHRRYRRGFEPGCSIGVLTARLASICEHVDAIDISPTAVRRRANAVRICPTLASIVVLYSRMFPRGRSTS